MNTKDKIMKGRTGLVLDSPFFGSLVLRLEMVEDESVGTFATNGKVIKYAPQFVEDLTLNQVKGILAHEVMHCAMAHHARMGSRDAHKWNDACDHAINHILLDSGFELTDGALNSPEYKDLSAEQIYGRLPANEDSEDRSSDGDGGGMGKVENAPGESGKPSPSELSKAESEWKIAMAQSAQQAKSNGNLPGALDRLVDEIINPKVDWLEVLRQFVNTTAKNDYAWFPPNRRYVSSGLYLPSMRSEELGEMTVVVDTSGSVNQEIVSQFSAELSSIGDHYRTDITVIHCDSKVQSVEFFPADSDIEIHPKGGGGTDFRPPFEKVADEGLPPACLVYLTDGYCSSFPDDPGYPVLWAVYGRHSEVFHPPFGEVVAV